jgi:SAM-dependent methyltransferase
VMEIDYDQFAEIYDVDMGRNIGDADVAFYLGLGAGRQPVLELGCGTGRIMQPFIERGIRIVGLDISARMREKAASRLASCDRACYELVSGDMCDFALPDRFAYAICAFSTYSKLLSVAQQESFFRSVHAHLVPDGRFVLDMFVQTPDFLSIPDDVLIEDYRDRWFEQQGCRVSRSKRLRKDVAPSVNQIDLVYSFRVNGSSTPAAERVLRDYTRYSTKQELDAHFRDHGFVVEQVYADYDGSVFGPDSRKMIFVARREL